MRLRSTSIGDRESMFLVTGCFVGVVEDIIGVVGVNVDIEVAGTVEVEFEVEVDGTVGFEVKVEGPFTVKEVGLGNKDKVKDDGAYEYDVTVSPNSCFTAVGPFPVEYFFNSMGGALLAATKFLCLQLGKFPSGFFSHSGKSMGRGKLPI